MSGNSFSLPDPDIRDLIQPAFMKTFAGWHETNGEERFDLLDSFDWRFFRKGYLVFYVQGQLRLQDLDSQRDLCSVRCDVGSIPLFAWDLPESDFTSQARKILEMRALLRMGSLIRRWNRTDLLNRDEKTVVRLAQEAWELEGKPRTIAFCRVLPLRGYEKAAHRARNRLMKLGMQQEAGHPVVDLLQTNGVAPGGFSTKVSVDLEPDLEAAEAVRLLLAHLITTMHLNLPGLKEDLDTEFLHDFRVAVRKGRSLLAQMKNVFDPDTTAGLQDHLKFIGGLTSQVRDLDVHLLNEAAYIQLVPSFLEPGIKQLFANLKRKRRRAFGRMIKAMEGEAFGATLTDLDAMVGLVPKPSTVTPAGSQPILPLAKATIFKRYQKILKMGKRIATDSPDEHFHDLRLQCKKLRYLLEFFTGLFPRKTVAGLIKQLKQLQETLGELNDINVQQEFMLAQLQNQRQTPMTSGATGGLITQMATTREEIRSQFFTAFEKFQSPRNRKNFRKLFS